MHLRLYGAFMPCVNAFCQVVFHSLLFFFFALVEGNTVPDEGRKNKNGCSRVIRTDVVKPRRRILAGGPADLVSRSRLNSRRIPVHSSVSVVQ